MILTYVGSTPGAAALSTDSGVTWSPDYGAPTNVTGGKVALSADGDTGNCSASFSGKRF